mmetsp:Transcript_11588/g.13221  ORF Transcript_11588/g.13221 Transcript_11588/m.13221 type:complete len:367 (-) Transcript_11588:164-1264(-)
MLCFRSLALIIVVSSLSNKNNCWIASAGSLRGDNKNDNTNVDVDVNVDVDEELSSSSRQLQLHNFDMNHNAYGNNNGYASNGYSNSNSNSNMIQSFFGDSYGEGYGSNYGAGYGDSYGNPLPPQPYGMNPGSNNNGGYGYGGNYGTNPIIPGPYVMNQGGGNNNGGYGGGYGVNFGTNPIVDSSNNYGYGANGAPQLQADARGLYDLMMQYRNSLGKPTVPISSGLTRVAEVHCEDLYASHYPMSGRNTTPEGCNTHSWYNPPNGATPCCYTADHNQAKCMWDKPKQLSSYQGNGYEIAHGPLPSANAAIWLEDWKRSKGHNDVIVENPPFQSPFHAVGVACCGTPDRQFAVTWFGTEYDQQSNNY